MRKYNRMGYDSHGSQPSREADQSNPFPYVFHWKREGRKGQRCQLVRTGKRTVEIRFPDGYLLIVNRAAIRRDDAMNEETKLKQQPGQPEPDEPDKDEEEEGDEQDQDSETPKVEKAPGNKGSQHGQTH